MSTPNNLAGPPSNAGGYQLPREHYLNATYGIRSWLLTTDHKRIALLYLVSVTFFFFIGGTFASLIRIHLLTPGGYLVTPETYNKLFTEKACATCHLPDGKGRAPSLNGVYQGRVLLADGSTVTADDAYLRESILAPNAKIVAGFQPLMPTFQGQLTEEEILALTSYIKSLQSQPVPATGAGVAPAGKK